MSPMTPDEVRAELRGDGPTWSPGSVAEAVSRGRARRRRALMLAAVAATLAVAAGTVGVNWLVRTGPGVAASPTSLASPGLPSPTTRGGPSTPVPSASGDPDNPAQAPVATGTLSPTALPDRLRGVLGAGARPWPWTMQLCRDLPLTYPELTRLEAAQGWRVDTGSGTREIAVLVFGAKVDATSFLHTVRDAVNACPDEQHSGYLFPVRPGEMPLGEDGLMVSKWTLEGPPDKARPVGGGYLAGFSLSGRAVVFTSVTTTKAGDQRSDAGTVSRVRGPIAELLPLLTGYA